MKLMINILCFFLLLTSCIGTIEDAKKVDRSTIKQDVKFSFGGVVDCHATSDKKVEVSFDPAYVTKGSVNPDELVYKVFLDGNFDNAVSSMMAKNLRVDSQGRFYLEVDNLGLNTNNSISVRVYDPASGNQDNNTATCLVRTMDQKLPIFDGLLEVVPYPGIEGQSSVLLKWTTAKAAEYLLGGIPAAGYKITKYNVYMSSQGDSINDLKLLTTLNESTSAPITQYQVSGLLQGQRYFFMVRAVDESGREEKNRRILAARTSTPQSLDFTGISSLTVPTNSSGYTSLRAEWNAPVGNFNRFKVFAIPETEAMYNSSSIDPDDNTFLTAEISNTTAVSSQVVGLTPETHYAVYVVACLLEDGKCISKAGDKKKLIAKTQPPLSPFAGINTITALDGVLGLNSVRVNWSSPAVTAGICSGIKLFQNDEPIKECGDPNLGEGEACLSSLNISCNSSNVTVANLTTDQEYCFSAAVYEGERVQVGPLVKKCVTTRFESPIFQSPATCTAIDGGTKLRIDWVKPSPEGLFTNYLVIVKKHPGTTVSPANFLNQAKGIIEGTSSDDHLPISERYRIITKSKGNLSHIVTGLSPDTEYNFMVKTHMSNSGIHYYDSDTTLVSCKTTPLSLNFGGWEHVLSIGPRIAGYADHRPGPSTETLFANISTYSLNEVSIPARGIESETLMTSGGITHPKVVKVETENKSKSGIVQLMWHELKTSDGLRLTEFLFNEGISLTPGVDGYFVYRKITPSFSNDAEYESILNQIQGSNSGWELLNPGEPILLTDGVGSFTDYLPDSFHPIHGAGGNFRQKANTGKVVWYTVRFRMNGALARYTENVNKDAIIPVIIPPANMAAIHHWMVNKKTCDFYKKDFDRNNNYRCLYGGLGARETDNNYYFDFNGHALIDRWTLGCNYNRHDEEEKICYNSNSTSVTLTQNNGGMYTASNTYSSYYYIDGEVKDKSGECSGHILTTSTFYNSSTLNYESYRWLFPNAKKGTVFYNNGDKSCYYRVGELMSSYTGTYPNHTLYWKKLGESNFEPTKPTAATTILPPALPNEFLNRIYPNNINPEDGLGIGAVLTSNDSSLPPIVNVNQDHAHFLCQSHAIQIQTGSTLSPYIRKRNIAGPEQIIASLPHPNTTNANRKSLEVSPNSNYASTYTPSSSPRPFTLGRRYSLTSSSYSGACSTYRDGGGDSFSRGLITKWVNSGNYQYPTLWVTGSYDVTGLLDNLFNGTERCVSGFGVQDYVGNVDYWLAERLLCRVNNNGTNADCDIAPSMNTISDYESLGNSWPSIRYSAQETSYYGQDYFKNALNNYFSMKYYNNVDYSSSFGVPTVRKTSYSYYNGSSYTNYPYGTITYLSNSLHFPFKESAFNFFTGTPLNCDSSYSYCHPDDNFNVSDATLPSGLTNFKDAYYQVEYNTSDLSPSSFQVRGRIRDNVKPAAGSQYNTSTTSTAYVQWFNLKDGTKEAVDASKVYHPFSTRWINNVTNADYIGVRCAVKLTLNPFGNVIRVDDTEP